MVPAATLRGMALYKFGSGPEIFLMPYPHASSLRSTADGRYAALLTKNGFTVITYDPPGFAKSTRTSHADLKEMMDTALECLHFFKISDPIIFTGHSMAGFCALALIIENPGIASKLILSGSPSGWSDVRKNSIHKKWPPCHKNYWLTRYWGLKIILGKANLRTHKKLDNLNSYEAFYHKDFFEEIEIYPEDKILPAPPRAKWLSHVRKYEYSGRLKEIRIPVLITSGKYDPVIPPKISSTMQKLIPQAEIVQFDHSGHSPFIEEPDYFISVVKTFLTDNQ